MHTYDLIIVGAGQSGLSAAYFARRAKLDFLLIDDRKEAGGMWKETWDSLRLFSPAEYSSLSGWAMPKGKEEYPSKDDFINYLIQYEKRYNFPIHRGIHIKSVIQKEGLFYLSSTNSTYTSRSVIWATGAHHTPYVPLIENSDVFRGLQLHSIDYRNPTPFLGKKTLVVGAGNSGAQIYSELSKQTQCVWTSKHSPSFLPDEVDGRYLFWEATQQYYQATKGIKSSKRKGDLKKIVMTPDLKASRQRGDLHARTASFSFYQQGVVWEDQQKEAFDAILYCTGFSLDLSPLAPLGVLLKNGRVRTHGCKATQLAGLWLIGLGNWTGYASATIYGVGKTARDALKEVKVYLKEKEKES